MSVCLSDGQAAARVQLPQSVLAGEPLESQARVFNPTQLAVPVGVGSVGRIPVGALTDRYGARSMFPAVSALTILPVLFIGYVGNDSYPMMLLGGFVLGLGVSHPPMAEAHGVAWVAPVKKMRAYLEGIEDVDDPALAKVMLTRLGEIFESPS